MKAFLATAAAILSVAAPAQAQIRTAAQLIHRGNEAMSTAIHVVKTTGSMSATCPHLKEAAAAYGASYTLHRDDRALSLMYEALNFYKKHC